MTKDDERRFQAALDEMNRAGIWPSNANPPVLQMLRKMGIAARPPHYGRFWPRFFGFAAFFGPIWGLLMWAAQWQGDGMSAGLAVAASALAGCLFSILMSGYYAISRKRAKLSNWDDL